MKQKMPGKLHLLTSASLLAIGNRRRCKTTNVSMSKALEGTNEPVDVQDIAAYATKGCITTSTSLVKAWLKASIRASQLDP